MRPITIPIRPESSQGDDALDYMPIPREMDTFVMPRPPEPGPDTAADDVAGARAVLAAFVDGLAQGLAEAGGELPVFDLAGLPAGTLRVLNESLGEGEVSAVCAAAHEIRVQETVFAGVWREQHLDGDRLLHDYLLAAPIPPVVGRLAAERASPSLRALPLPPGAMNVPALVSELQEAMDHSGAGAPAHVINLTLLPLSPQDVAHLDALLAGGSVVVLSRGFGNCRISSTAARNVWRVQYYNNMQTLILNTLEVATMPEVALAAPEDLLETRGRLAELVDWMRESESATAR